MHFEVAPHPSSIPTALVFFFRGPLPAAPSTVPIWEGTVSRTDPIGGASGGFGVGFALARDLLIPTGMAHGHRPPLTLLLVVLTACAAPESDGPPNGTDGSTGAESQGGSMGENGSESGTPAADSSGDDPGDSSTSLDPSGGTDETDEDIDSTSSGGGEAPPPDYATPHFPLQIGLQWSYRLTRTDGTLGADCLDNGDIHVMTISEESGGVFTRTEEPTCDFDTLEYRIDPPYVDVNSGAWYRQLRLPPEDGATWAAGGASGATYIWDEHHPSYSVEAGTFDDCWRRKQQGYDVWEIYCRDVGMVESYYDAWGSNTRSELVSFAG